MRSGTSKHCVSDKVLGVKSPFTLKEKADILGTVYVFVLGFHLSVLMKDIIDCKLTIDLNSSRTFLLLGVVAFAPSSTAVTNC